MADKTVFTGEKLRKAMLWMSSGKNAQIFHGMKPQQMARLVRDRKPNNNLPTTSEGMALLIYALRACKMTPGLIPMIQEVRMTKDGPALVVRGQVTDEQVAKHKHRVLDPTESKLMDLRRSVN